LVDLFQKSIKDAEKAKRSYEAHFNDKFNEAITLRKILEEVEMPNLTVADYMDMENTIVEYNLNDVFGTLTRLPLSP
jgi:DNA polymerase I-like protein with 3'-5' exonuclease and polymerase domains